MVVLRIIFLLLIATGMSWLNAEGNPIIEAPYQPDYAKGLPERHLWSEVREEFMRTHYQEILNRYGIRLNCGTCTTVYADFPLSVSLTGKVKIRDVTIAKACGKPMAKKMLSDFSRYLRSYQYKPGLFGTTVLLRLGTGLKC